MNTDLLQIESAPANLVRVGWADGDDAARASGHEMIDAMLNMGWRMLDGLAPWQGRWSATLFYEVSWGHSLEQQNFRDATIAEYIGHADHARMQWLAEQTRDWSGVTLKIGDWVVGSHDTIRDLLDKAIMENATANKNQ